MWMGRGEWGVEKKESEVAYFLHCHARETLATNYKNRRGLHKFKMMTKANKGFLGRMNFT
jgi:hypothetical protein